MGGYKSRRLHISQSKCFESQASSRMRDKIEKPTEENEKTCKDPECSRKPTDHCRNKTHATHTFLVSLEDEKVPATEERAGPCRERERGQGRETADGSKVACKVQVLQVLLSRLCQVVSSRHCLELTSRAVPFQSPALWRAIL